MRGLVGRLAAEHRVEIFWRRGGDGVGRRDDLVAASLHAAQKKGRDNFPQPGGAGHEPLECFGPDIHHVDHEQGIEPLGEPGRGLRPLQGRQAREDDVGPLELAGGDRFGGEPLEGAAEVAMAVQAGQRNIFLIGPHGHQPHGKALLLANAQRHVAAGLAAVAPVGAPPDHVVAAAGEHAGQRPIAQRRNPLSGDVIERVNDPD